MSTSVFPNRPCRPSLVSEVSIKIPSDIGPVVTLGLCMIPALAVLLSAQTSSPLSCCGLPERFGEVDAVTVLIAAVCGCRLTGPVLAAIVRVGADVGLAAANRALG